MNNSFDFYIVKYQLSKTSGWTIMIIKIYKNTGTYTACLQ